MNGKCMYATFSASKKLPGSKQQPNAGEYKVSDSVRFNQVQITDQSRSICSQTIL